MTLDLADILRGDIMLDKAVREHYQSKGWVVVNGVFETDEVDR
jgi:hypothetical protein